MIIIPYQFNFPLRPRCYCLLLPAHPHELIKSWHFTKSGGRSDIGGLGGGPSHPRRQCMVPELLRPQLTSADPSTRCTHCMQHCVVTTCTTTMMERMDMPRPLTIVPPISDPSKFIYHHPSCCSLLISQSPVSNYPLGQTVSYFGCSLRYISLSMKSSAVKETQKTQFEYISTSRAIQSHRLWKFIIKSMAHSVLLPSWLHLNATLLKVQT